MAASPIAELPLHAPRDEGDDEVDGGPAGPPLLAVVEASRGSAHKLKFDADLGVFRLHSALPLGAVFPFDFGFLPRTRGDDGDPLDVLLLMDEPAPPGTVVACRLLGVIEAEQRKAGEPRAAFERNDRLLAVADPSQRHGHCRALDDLAGPLLDQVERFFGFYTAQKGTDFRVIGRAGPAVARTLVEEGARRHRRPSRKTAVKAKGKAKGKGKAKRA